MTVSRTALIVGAGIGGLAAGVALQRAWWNVRIFERARTPRELGFALLLAPNAVASLRRLGLAEIAIAGGASPAGAEIRGRGGRLLRSFDTTAARALLPEPVIVVLRPLLHGALLDAVGKDALVLGTPASGFEIHDGRPVLHLADGSTSMGEVLIGADGVGSAIRKVLHPGEPPPRRSGLWAVRGVAHHDGALDGDAAGGQYFGRGTEGGISPASRTDIYWYLSIPAELLGASREPLEIARRAAAEFDDRFRRIVAMTAAEDARLDELLDRDPMDRWGRGPVTLLGDAAHPMLPHAGQGAAQALEDAVALGHVLGRAGPVDAALRHYETVRAPRTRTIVNAARRNARLGSVRSPLGQWLRDTAIRLVPDSQFLKAYVAFGKPPELEP